MTHRLALGLASALSLGPLATAALAAGTGFDDFTPLPASAGPIQVGDPGEALPLSLSNPAFSQRSIADRATQNAAAPGSNSGNWDMITTNETGPDAGRWLFVPFESSSAGVQRIDLENPDHGTRTVTIVAPGTQSFYGGDASYWAPWGSYLTAEESWSSGSTRGRLFEVPDATSAGANGGTLVWRDAVPRVSHEGLAFDRERNLYFIDELDGGSIYKFVSASPFAADGNGFFAAGQTFALRVGAGGQAEGNAGPAIQGAAAWEAITDPFGGPLTGVSVLVPDGTIDGRASADDDQVRASGFNRPEDLVIRALPGADQILFFTATAADTDATESNGTSRVYALNLASLEVSLFADSGVLDLASGLPVGGALNNADNLAMDAVGNLYVVEDRPGGVDDDIWFAKDMNLDGDLLDAGEGLARWASNGVQGSELTGLYFDPLNPNRAWVNIQHPASGNDRTLEILAPADPVPTPGAIWLLLAGLPGLLAGVRDRLGAGLPTRRRGAAQAPAASPATV